MKYILKKDWLSIKDSNDHEVQTKENISFNVIALKKLELSGKAKINSHILEIFESLRRNDSISGANLYPGNEQLRHCLITHSTGRNIHCKWYSEKNCGILVEKSVSLIISDYLSAEEYLKTLEEVKIISRANLGTFVIVNDEEFNQLAGIIEVDPALELQAWFLNKKAGFFN